MLKMNLSENYSPNKLLPMKNIFSLSVFFAFPILLAAQFDFYTQYFDGADTLSTSIQIEFDTTGTNIWQVGPPQKTIFSSAATAPNVLVTDTVNFYPTNNSSSFQFTLNNFDYWWGILAIQWKQKLDMDAGDGGVIEFSTDSGATWQNAFDNPYVYNLFGFDSANVDTLAGGERAFTGTDTLWRDIWLCFDISYLGYGNDPPLMRFTFKSDSIDSNHEGWMMDNLSYHITILHTVSEVEQKEYLKVYPNPTRGRVNIQAKKNNEFHIIEKMELINANGQVVQEFGVSPTKFYIDIDDHPDGIYFLKVQTNKKTEAVQILLQRE